MFTDELLFLLLLLIRLNNEQRAAIADYFHVYKVNVHTDTGFISLCSNSNKVYLFCLRVARTVKKRFL